MNTRISVDLFNADGGDSIGVARLARSEQEKAKFVEAANVWGLRIREMEIPAGARLFSVVISNDDGRFEDELRTGYEVEQILTARLTLKQLSKFTKVLCAEADSARIETASTFVEVTRTQ